MIQSIIIEDEPNNEELLRTLLKTYCPEVEVLGSVRTVKEGLEMVLKLLPEIIFLDIELPDGKGFDLLDQIRELPVRPIFTTGYDEYAVKAIRYAAFDYLTKPIDIEELQNAIQRYQEQRAQKEEPIRFYISNNGQSRILDAEQVLYLQADSGYTVFYLENDKVVSSESLSSFTKLFPDFYVQTHRSTVVNARKVTHIDGGRGGKITVANQFRVPIATRRKPEVVDLIKSKNSTLTN
jgi:two-component system LytT family response regulator